MWLSTQTPHQDKLVLGLVLGLEPEQVRVIAPDVGGGFGGKGLDVEDVILGWLARATGRPVKWTETRSENLVAMHHGRAQLCDFEIGGDRDGKVQALRVKILQDGGAYPGIGAFLANLTALMSSGVYAIPKIETEVIALVTNSTPTGPVRGAGRPEATQMIERAMDLFAAELSLDPTEVRRRNFIAADAFPATTASGAHYDIGDYEGALDLALETAGYEELRREQAQRRERGDVLAARDRRQRLCRDHQRDQRVRVRRGRDHAPTARRSSAPARSRRARVTRRRSRRSSPSGSASRSRRSPCSRATPTRSRAAPAPTAPSRPRSAAPPPGQASEVLVERAKELAANELEASAEDMVLDLELGRFHVAGAPEPGLDWRELAARLEDDGRLAELSAEADFAPAQPTFPFGAHVAVVEVDTETGSVHLQRMIAVDDAGTIINPLVADGQVHGGVAAGIAQALFEELRYDSDGNPQNANLVTYCMPAAPELPSFELVEMETPTPINPLGAKGIGESGTIGATPAVQSAVIDAVSHLGVRHIDMPVNGQRVWQALRDAAASAGRPPGPGSAPSSRSAARAGPRRRRSSRPDGGARAPSRGRSRR